MNAQLTQAQMQIANELEIEMMQDLYTRLAKIPKMNISL